MTKEVIRLKPECINCVLEKNLNLCPEDMDGKTRIEYMQRLMKILADASLDVCVPALNPSIYQLKREMLGIEPEDYTETKRYFNALMMEKVEGIQKKIKEAEDPFRLALQYAMTGNYIDFGAVDHVNVEDLEALLEKASQIPLKEQELKQLQKEIEEAENIVYLTDNCGEVVMDKLFIEEIKKKNPEAALTVLVRGEEILNDATLVDAKQIGLTEVAPVMGNGSGIAGTSLKDISSEARELLEKADVILAKGQGNFETLQMCGMNIYYLFLCKCDMFRVRFNVPKFTGMLVNDRRLD